MDCNYSISDTREETRSTPCTFWSEEDEELANSEILSILKHAPSPVKYCHAIDIDNIIEDEFPVNSLNNKNISSDTGRSESMFKPLRHEN